MKIGFTGTREGMTTDQWYRVEWLLFRKFEGGKLNEWHDGDCIGADSQAHGVVERLARQAFLVKLIGHPCNLPGDVRAFNEFNEVCEVKPPLVRNRDIVDAVDLMIAAPKEYDEVIRGSGTWAMIRYARRNNKPLIIVWPDGNYVAEGA
jgi:hypothetical protein